jgi:hypothetical protein
MNRASAFIFTDTASLDANTFVVRVRIGLETADALLQSLFEEARLPGYFGFNWDALSDCLRDLHWVEPKEVVLVHADLPKLPRADLRTYLDVLAECVASWQPGEEHSLTVVFPAWARAEVAILD